MFYYISVVQCYTANVPGLSSYARESRLPSNIYKLRQSRVILSLLSKTLTALFVRP